MIPLAYAECAGAGDGDRMHRHKGSSETCVCVRGHFEEYFYDSGGHLTETVDMAPGGVVLNIEAGQWHGLKCLESGTVLLTVIGENYMPRRNRAVLNRGRLQAQGDGLEKSRPWADANVPTKQNGHMFIMELKSQLTHAELAIRDNCFAKAEQWVDEAPNTGYVVVTPIKTSFQPYPPIRDVRVDGELYSGAAFKD